MSNRIGPLLRRGAGCFDDDDEFALLAGARYAHVSPDALGAVADIGDGWQDDLSVAIAGLQTELQATVKATTRLVSLEDRVRTLETTTVASVASLTEFKLGLLRDIPVTIRHTGDDCVATFFDANLSASGDTPEEAFFNLKDILATTFHMFSQMDPAILGPMPKRQLRVLSEFMQPG